jgi:hypothetical protein
MPEWTYQVADLLTGVIAAELPLANVSITKPINDSGTFGGDLNLAYNTGVDDPYGLTTPARTAIYAFRDGIPYWGGIIWTRRYNSISKVVNIGAADWWSYFDHRKIVPLLDTIDGASAVASYQVPFTAVDQNAIARALITLAQTHTGGNIGITLDSSLSGVNLTQTYMGYSLTNVADGLRALTKLNGGPDIRFDVGTPQDGTNRPQRRMFIGAPLLGVEDGLVFEYGGNLISYEWPSDGTRMGVRQYDVGAGSDVSTPICIHEDTAKYGDGWPLLEAETAHDTVTDIPTLLSYTRADQAAASLPVVIPTIVVNSSMDPALGQYAPGDYARVIIQDEFMINGIDTTLRIASINVSPGDTVEQASLVMNPTQDDVV